MPGRVSVNGPASLPVPPLTLDELNEAAGHFIGDQMQTPPMVSAVKIEGGSQIAEIAKRLVDIGVPVMGHLGLTPQSVHQLGGFRQQGRDSQAAEKLMRDAELLEKSGVKRLNSV